VLLSLRLTDFGVLEEAEVTFGPGLTVLTGETGAGKSMLLGALGLMLGGRAEADVVRAGAEEAVVEGVLEKTSVLGARLDELGLPDLGAEVVIRRVVGRAGRPRVHVNGALTTVGVLGRLMRGQLELNGQHEHMVLLDPTEHLPLLDRAAKLTGEAGPLATYARAWAAVRDAERALSEQGKDSADVEFLEFQLDEIDRIAPRAGEDVALDALRRRLASAERLKEAAAEAEHALSLREESASELIGRCVFRLSEAEKADATIAPMRQRLVSLQAELDELVRELSRYGAAVESDATQLHDTEERLEALKRLCRKHAAPLEAVIARRDELAAKIVEVKGRAERQQQLLAARDAAKEELVRACGPLTQARKKAAAVLEHAVRERLARLAMGKGTFEVRLTAASPGPSGADAVELWFSANAGEPARPLHKVASGGEASRLMLALRTALSDDDACTCVFDEADAGVGGAVADAVGRLLKELSARRQVLCVTHLPQVAAHASAHLRIQKGEGRGRTRSVVTDLFAAEARERELARMLSGVEISQQAVGAARALLQAARREPKRRGRAA
jgi:DNA repair protein RecN (Recombination protein N)